MGDVEQLERRHYLTGMYVPISAFGGGGVEGKGRQSTRACTPSPLPTPFCAHALHYFRSAPLIPELHGRLPGGLPSRMRAQRIQRKMQKSKCIPSESEVRRLRDVCLRQAR